MDFGHFEWFLLVFGDFGTFWSDFERFWSHFGCFWSFWTLVRQLGFLMWLLCVFP